MQCLFGQFGLAPGQQSKPVQDLMVWMSSSHWGAKVFLNSTQGGNPFLPSLGYSTIIWIIYRMKSALILDRHISLIMTSLLSSHPLVMPLHNYLNPRGPRYILPQHVTTILTSVGACHCLILFCDRIINKHTETNLTFKANYK